MDPDREKVFEDKNDFGNACFLCTRAKGVVLSCMPAAL